MSFRVRGMMDMMHGFVVYRCVMYRLMVNRCVVNRCRFMMYLRVMHRLVRFMVRMMHLMVFFMHRCVMTC